MKKIVTLCLGLMAALAIHAQSDFPIQFADKDGNIIADGTTLNLTEAIADDFGDVQVPSHLYVKNTTDDVVGVGGVYTITRIENGDFQTCFPVNCIRNSAVGEYETGADGLAANQLKDMQTEWFPLEEGTCVVTYQLVSCKQNALTKVWTKDKYGPKVTLNFSYSPAGVSAVKAGKNVRSVEYYNLTGRRVQTAGRGMYIVKTTYADGTVKSKKVRR